MRDPDDLFDDVDRATLAAEERTADAELIEHLQEDQEEETPFDETRHQYSGVEEGDGDVDVEELAESGALFDDPDDTDVD